VPALDVYRRKRDFSRTREPSGKVRTKAAAKSHFVIQHHFARREHYDLRLELNGVLKSWAVPKGPSEDPHDKRLAVEVEDHPLEYASFEGEIPSGQYGAGKVEIWDKGWWEPAAGVDAAEGLRKGSLKFVLHGKRLRGSWVLVRMKARERRGKNNWLLIREREDRVKSATKLTTGGEHAARNGRVSRPSLGRSVDPSLLDGAEKAPMPRLVQPQLATLVETVPEGSDWRHEVKFDGYRILAMIRDGEVRLMTRNHKDWTERFRSVAQAVVARKWREGVLDGEVVALNERGLSDFQALQRAMESGAGLHYCIFDVPHWNGWDLTACDLADRQALLARVLGKKNGLIRFSEYIDGEGAEVLRAACRLDLEGVVSKRIDSPYVQGRSRTWVKSRCGARQEMVIGGYTDPRRSRESFGALLLGHYKDGELIYGGKVGTGFDDFTLRSLGARLKKLEQDRPPFSARPPAAAARTAHWVRPDLVAEVRFTQWTSDGRMRHPVFLGLRSDKMARQVMRESPKSPKTRPTRKGARTSKSAVVSPPATGPVVADREITNPGRVVYPEVGLTKLDVARYYEVMADKILPHLAGRPLSVVRCPQGASGACFFNKHLDVKGIAGLTSINIRESKGTRPYVIVQDERGLVYLAQMNVLELHAWGSTAKDLEHPDRLVFDLDPGDGATWSMVAEGARRIRDILKAVGLRSFLRTTGGKGLHVVAPIRPRADWETIKAATKTIAGRLARDDPDHFIDSMSKAKRRGKVFVDYLRNQRGATSIVAFSTRARSAATVSALIDWKDLDAFVPDRFTLAGFLAKPPRSDPWREFWSLKQDWKFS
jgi:bifunctional non-homologous end joining protein LigD